MPRRARLRIAGVPWHIVQRGNNRSGCFFAEHDYWTYLETLEHLSGQFHCAIHAYALMTNHVHLLLSPLDVSGPSMMMKLLGQRYVQYINRTYRRSGSLWEGRFRSCLVQSEAYLLTCHRYIELNPVRAGMVDHPRAYRWSSHRCNAEGEPNALITPHEEYERLGQSDRSRREAYRALFANPEEPARVEAIRHSTNGNTVLGDDAFQVQVEGVLGRRAGRGAPGRPRRQAGSRGEQTDLC